MSRPSKGNLSAWLRGGQTIGHTFDMIREVLARIVIVLILWGAVCVICVNLRASDDEQSYGTLALMANVLEWVGPPAPQLISVPTPGRGPRPYPVGEVEQLSWVAPHAYGYFHHAKLGFALWIMGAALTGIATAYWYTRAGKEKLKTRQIRGQQVVRAPQLAHEITLFNQEQAKAKNRPDHLPANLVGIPYPMDAEQEHTLITGSPGAGKSVAMHRLIRSVRARGDRGVVYDPELEYIAQHYNPETDLILNPFDERSPAWSPFHDATDHVEWDRLAHGLFKDPKSGDPYWSNVARSLFSWTCFTLKERDPNVSLDTALNMLFGSTKPLERLLVGTPAHKHISGGAGPRVSSIESVLVEGVTPLVYLLGKGEPFSIRRWVNQERRTPGLLFLSAPETHADTLRPLLGFWSEIVISALLSRNAEGIAPHPTWLFLDEFPSLSRIDKLADGPQRLRKYGGAMVFGMQQVSQIQEIYGKEKASTIMGQCLNKLILRCSDYQTAQIMSETIGERVMHRVSENTSYGANSIRDGVGIAPREEKEPVYLPTDLMNLPSLQGVIRMSNKRAGRPFPIAPVAFSFDASPRIADPYVPRTGPDPIREFIARARGERPDDPAEGTAAAPAAAAGGPVLVAVDGDLVVDGEADEAVNENDLVADPGALPTEKGRAISLARAEAAREEAARENEQKQQRELFDGDRPTPEPRPAGEEHSLGSLGELTGDYGRGL